MSIDTRTLLVMGAMMSALMAVVLDLMRRSYPSSVRGLGWWSLSPLFWLCASLLYSRNDHWSDWLTVVVANVLMLSGVLAHYAGTRQFFNAAPRWGWVLALLGLTFLVVSFFTFVKPSYAWRTVYLSAAMAGICARYAYFVARKSQGRVPERMMVTILSFQTVVLVVRCITSLNGIGVAGFTDGSVMQVAFMSMYTLSVAAFTIGAVTLANDRLRRELERLAVTDGLTGLLNRRAFMERAESELRRAARTQQAPALLLIDLDHFKRLNDTHGHAHGDAVLRHFAEQMRSKLRSMDLVGRYGGEEFVVLLPQTPLEGALEAAEHLHASQRQEHPLSCPLSVGATVWRGKDDSLDAMLLRADQALYSAKDKGRNQTCSQP